MTGFTSGMKSSLTDQWATPQHLFDALDSEFGFTLDVCADESNHKVSTYYDKAANGLEQPWTGVCWMNPPYGRAIGDWVRKAYESSRGGGGSGLPFTRQNGHKMVEGLRHESQRVEVHKRSRQVRRCRTGRTIPVGHRHIRHTDNASD